MFFFSPLALNMAAVGGGGGGTGAFDLTSPTTGTTLDVTATDGLVRSVNVSNDGTKIYALGRNNNRVFQWTMSTANDLTTVGSATSFSHSTQTTTAEDVYFSDDGTKMWITTNNAGTHYQYTLSTAWDVTTASYDTKVLDCSGEDTGPYGGCISPDGTKMLVAGRGSTPDTCYEYSLSTANDASTASYTSNSFDFGTATGETNFCCVRYSGDGTKVYMGSFGDDQIEQYPLSTAFDLSTIGSSEATYSATNFMFGFAFTKDGQNFYLIESGTNEIIRHFTA